MRLFETTEPKGFKLTDCVKLAHTTDFAHKLEEALKTVEYFLTITKNPAVSFGGGKDGTAVLILAQMIDPNISVICADPPNPLPDRNTHIINFLNTCSTKITRIPYDWDVDAVLNGVEEYPEKLKIKTLNALRQEKEYDGIIWGCRNSESNQRRINFARNGYIYQVADGTYRCQPIAKWTAEESFALALLFDYPVNPVYEKMDGIYNLDGLHDGTWYPHGNTKSVDFKRDWIKKYYPDYYDLYLRAIEIGGSNGKELQL